VFRIAGLQGILVLPPLNFISEVPNNLKRKHCTFATQMFAPSNATPRGFAPTLKVPSVTPSLARSLVTLLLRLLVTQTLAPSNAAELG
jgi:hypothetical protein